MPHAALWVVQLIKHGEDVIIIHGFNAARGFVGGAARYQGMLLLTYTSFNAARGFVGGAASSLAALVPLGRKSPFGKSPEI